VNATFSRVAVAHSVVTREQVTQQQRADPGRTAQARSARGSRPWPGRQALHVGHVEGYTRASHAHASPRQLAGETVLRDELSSTLRAESG
jgi:hypothetical protein